MKLVTIAIDTPLGPIERVGSMRGADAIDLAAAYEALLTQRDSVPRAKEIAEAIIPSEMVAFLSGWPIGRDAASEAIGFAGSLSSEEAGQFPGTGRAIVHSSGSFRLAPPLRPVRVKDYLTYEEHKRKAMARRGEDLPELWYRMPTYTNRNHMAIAGPDDPIAWPHYSKKLDVEFVIGLIVGKMGRDIRAEDAADYIAGFTIYNDVSARDTQADERACGSGPGKSKDFDQGNIVGPCITTADEIDGQAIEMSLRIDGEEWARGNTSGMKHSWGKVIENASRGETIFPGDLFGSGTMDGGCCAELNRWFEPGATIEMEAQGIGVLRNRVG